MEKIYIHIEKIILRHSAKKRTVVLGTMVNATEEDFIKILRLIRRIDLLERIELKGEDKNDK